MSRQFGIPGIVCNGVVVPYSGVALPEGMDVEIRLEPGEFPQTVRSEIEAWGTANDESWKWIDQLESDEK